MAVIKAGVCVCVCACGMNLQLSTEHYSNLITFNGRYRSIIQWQLRSCPHGYFSFLHGKTEFMMGTHKIFTLEDNNREALCYCKSAIVVCYTMRTTWHYDNSRNRGGWGGIEVERGVEVNGRIG